MENNRVEEMLNTVEKVMLLICGNNEPGIAVFDICKKKTSWNNYTIVSFQEFALKGGFNKIFNKQDDDLDSQKWRCQRENDEQFKCDGYCVTARNGNSTHHLL